MQDKIVIGIDPGSILCGYGIIRKELGSTIYITAGQIAMPKKLPLSVRLKYLYEGLSEIFHTYQPDEAVIEKIFFAKGIKSALHLGHARGVAMLTASMQDIPVIEYSALEIKQSVTGYGHADKNQVQHMVKAILGINLTLSFDSSDALAMALCHSHTMDYKIHTPLVWS
jgi:crossover junction endodeoxyribonuclease RuvC